MAYNSTPFHGKVARVEKNNVKVEFTDGWNLDVVLDMADASRQGQDWKEALPGQAGWSGSFSGQLVLGNTEQKAFVDNIIASTPGAKLTDVKFLLDSDTNAFTGDIYLTGFHPGGTVGDKFAFSFDFQGNGALSLTDSA